jgi:hypothetical protein
MGSTSVGYSIGWNPLAEHQLTVGIMTIAAADGAGLGRTAGSLRSPAALLWGSAAEHGVMWTREFSRQRRVP